MRQNLLRLFLFLVVLVILGVVGAAVLVTTTVNQVESSISNLQRVVNSITSTADYGLSMSDFYRLRSSLGEVSKSFASAYNRAQLVRPVLATRPDILVNVTLLEAGTKLADSAEETMDGLEPTLNYLFGDQQSDDSLVVQISTGERLVELLRIGQPSFISAAQSLAEAREIMARIDISDASPQLLAQIQQFETYAHLLDTVHSIVGDSSDLIRMALGIGGEASYLVLAVNNDEIRPSGGYLSTYGYLVVRNGRLEDYDYSASTITSPNPPPEYLSSEVQIPSWWIQYGIPITAAWDGSWTPDFPQTAERAMWYYNNGGNPVSPVQGVISIDVTAFEYILEALGQVYVTDYNITVTPDNFRDVVYSIRAGTEESVESGDREHKRFLAALYRQIFSDWQTRASDSDFSAQILGVLLRSLQEKHLMLYFADSEINQALDVLGWSGHQSTTPGSDYLMVVDTNLGNKSNNSVRRQLIYDVELMPDASAQSTTTVLYDYSASIAASDPAVDERYHGPLDYLNLLQVFVPHGVTLSETTGGLYNLQTINELTDFTQFVSTMRLSYDSSQRYQYSYTVPNVVQPYGIYSRYVLHLQKQPGMRGELAIVQITLPENASAVRMNPYPTATYDIEREILEYRMDFTSDIDIEILYVDGAALAAAARQ